jgi:anti-sigma-K factor RskA
MTRGMDKEQLEALLIDYIDGKLNEADRQTVEQELMKNEGSYALYEQLKKVIHAMERSSKLQPSAALKTSFDEMLKKEIASSAPKSKVIFFTPAFYRVAAAVLLLVVGGGAGYLISKYQRQQEAIAKLQEQMDDTKNAMLSMMDNNQSASQRIQGVNVALTIEKADDEVVKALVNVLNEDANTNVRLAALEALSKFYYEAGVRKALVAALPKQKDPIVQISLIQLLVKMKEKGVMNDLKRIIDDEQAIKPVKDEAYTGIMKLS